eukprot:2984543-Rhodomonas_salina.3
MLTCCPVLFLCRQSCSSPSSPRAAQPPSASTSPSNGHVPTASQTAPQKSRKRLQKFGTDATYRAAEVAWSMSSGALAACSGNNVHLWQIPVSQTMRLREALTLFSGVAMGPLGGTNLRPCGPSPSHLPTRLAQTSKFLPGPSLSLRSRLPSLSPSHL